ncbi:hypothetical protein ACVIJW_000779 [Bradyrhizobium barranii subsp. barranii]
MASVEQLRRREGVNLVQLEADIASVRTGSSIASPAGHFKFLRVWSVKFLHPRGRTRDC